MGALIGGRVVISSPSSMGAFTLDGVGNGDDVPAPRAPSPPGERVRASTDGEVVRLLNVSMFLQEDDVFFSCEEDDVAPCHNPKNRPPKNHQSNGLNPSKDILHDGDGFLSCEDDDDDVAPHHQAMAFAGGDDVLVEHMSEEELGKEAALGAVAVSKAAVLDFNGNNEAAVLESIENVKSFEARVVVCNDLGEGGKGGEAAVTLGNGAVVVPVTGGDREGPDAASKGALEGIACSVLGPDDNPTVCIFNNGFKIRSPKRRPRKIRKKGCNGINLWSKDGNKRIPVKEIKQDACVCELNDLCLQLYERGFLLKEIIEMCDFADSNRQKFFDRAWRVVEDYDSMDFLLIAEGSEDFFKTMSKNCKLVFHSIRKTATEIRYEVTKMSGRHINDPFCA
uniref:Uncharacterized protein n=1 Tax=Leersia perrieri TaxID=77586 RepID=A0A0D9VXG5_9ORYZ